MNVEIRTEAAQFLFGKKLYRIFLQGIFLLMIAEIYDGFFRHTVYLFTEFCKVRWIVSYFDAKLIKYNTEKKVDGKLRQPDRM